MTQVSYDHRSVLIDGQRELVTSGAIHYPRSTPAMWPDLMRRSKAAGLNTIETYVFWNLHERQRGVFDFSGRLDLLHFCRLAAEQGLRVILRIGPYICAETNFGGLPPWLRDVPGMQTRTWNEPFMREMERWVRLLCDYLHTMFAAAGGPIIMVQLENEYNNIAKNYGKPGARYLQWCVKLAKSLKLRVPCVMCAGAAKGALETINSNFGHTQLDQHFANHPDQPALWTEFYPGWYGTWGRPSFNRPPQEIAYAAARFYAGGGTGTNFYMWHGGTNFDRETMYLQTTSYDFNAPLDEYGLETTKSRHLSRLHHLLLDNSATLLNNDPPKPVSLGEGQLAFTYGQDKEALTFLCNDGAAEATVTFEGRSYPLPAKAVVIVQAGNTLLNTAAVEPSCVVQRTFAPVAGALSAFSWAPEPLPGEWPAALRSVVEAPQPIEQLALTRDKTDYCWYTSSLNVAAGSAAVPAGKGVLKLSAAADVVHVYVDGKFVATSPWLREDRGKIDSDGYVQAHELELAPGKHELSLLCCSLGLIKGDWMLGQTNMVNERKGLWGPVYWKDQPLAGPWRMQAGLAGEKCRYFGDSAALVPWSSDVAAETDSCHPQAYSLGGESRGTPQSAIGQPLRWWRSTFARPAGDEPLALDLGGMGKGMIYLNGQCLGRYWSIRGTDSDMAYLVGSVQFERMGEITQRYYHVPADWLADNNTLTLCEELGGDPTTIQLCKRV